MDNSDIHVALERIVSDGHHGVSADGSGNHHFAARTGITDDSDLAVHQLADKVGFGNLRLLSPVCIPPSGVQQGVVLGADRNESGLLFGAVIVNLIQRGAPLKRALSDAFQSRGQGDRNQILTTDEDISIDVGDALGNDNGGNTAVRESAVLDANHGVAIHFVGNDDGAAISTVAGDNRIVIRIQVVEILTAGGCGLLLQRRHGADPSIVPGSIVQGIVFNLNVDKIARLLRTGIIHVGQAVTETEGRLLNVAHGGRQSDLLQSRTAVEGILTDISDPLGDGDLPQGLAIAECIVADEIDAIRQIHALQTEATVKGAVAQYLHPIGDGNLFQRNAKIKRMCSDLFHTGAEVDLFQALTGHEGIIVDDLDVVAHIHGLQEGAHAKGVIADLHHAIRDVHLGQPI